MTFGWTGRIGALQKHPMLSALAMAGLLLPLSPADAGGVSAVDMDGQRVTLRFEDQVPAASAFLLDAPHRLAIDIPGADAAPTRFAAIGDGIAAIRQGRTEAGARVVFDLNGPAVARDLRLATDGRSLSFSLKPVSDRAFSAALGDGRSEVTAPVANAAPRPRRTHSITIPIPVVAKGVQLPPVEGPRDSGRPLVVIDAGHGGHDPGAINGDHGYREKDVTLAIAQALRDELLKSGRVRVALTRDDDRFLVLQERYGIARRLNADLFISIHADAADNKDAHGATVYTLSETASDREAARLAARENKSDIINGVNLGGQSTDVSSILIDLTQRESMNISSGFARLLHREASTQVAFRPDFHRFASLMVLKAPDIPSVLFETGYISNDKDASFLASSDGQRRVARGVARAIEVHFARKLAAR